MAGSFQHTPITRLVNGSVTRLIRLGVPLGDMALLTVAGRRSGHRRTTPVVIGQHAGQRWVLSPYGEVDWVRNLRAAGTAELTRRRRTETVRAVELPPDEAALLIRETAQDAPSFIRRQLGVTASSSPDEFRESASCHPVFRLESRP